MQKSRDHPKNEFKRKPFSHRKRVNLISIILTMAIVATSFGFLGSVFDRPSSGSGGSSSSNNSNTGNNNGSNSNDNNSDHELVRLYDCVLVNDPDELSLGDKVIITTRDFQYALSMNVDGFSCVHPSATVLGDNILFTIDPKVLVLEVGIYEGSYAFSVDLDYIACLSSDSLSLGVESTVSDKSSWDIGIVDGKANVCVSANKPITLRFGDDTFKLYNSESESGFDNSKDIAIIKVNNVSEFDPDDVNG